MPAESPRSRVRCSIIGLLAGGLAIAASALSVPAKAAETLVLYSGQHEQTVDALVASFEKQTGIVVKVHSGDGPELANQILAEGRSSPADVYFTENSPELQLLAEKQLLAPVRSATLAQIPARFSSRHGEWLGVLARENVLAYNTTAERPAELPPSLLDLASPDWKGKVGIAPADSDFLPLVSAVIASKGRQAALRWLRGLEHNARIFDDDEGVVAAVDRGAVATGIVNNYYWERLRVQNGAGGMHSAIHHFAGGDIGNIINVSGAAILLSSKHKPAAQRFLAFLVSAPTQTALGRSNVTFEYPLRPGIPANPALKPLDQLHPPAISLDALGDDAAAAGLLRQAGLL